MVDLSVKIGSLTLKNPVMTASGTFGYGEEFADFIDLSRLGGIIVKGTTGERRQGNPYPRMAVCDIYVQPSYEESHSLTVEEAKILCRPVVSTETVGGKLLVEPEKTGLLCEISAADLAAKLERLMTDVMYEAPGNAKMKKVVVTAKMVRERQ